MIGATEILSAILDDDNDAEAASTRAGARAQGFPRKPVHVEELLLRVRDMVEVRLLYKKHAAAAVRT